MADFERAVAQVYARLRGPLGAREGQDACPMFGVVWASTRVLARAVAADPDLAGARALELGCGLALPSLAAARLGARVTATDQHPHAEAFLAHNLAANGLAGRVGFHRWHWSEPPPAGLPERGFERVMASDVLFAWDLPDLLASTFDRMLAPGGIGWLADPGRAWADRFEPACRARGLEVSLEADPDGFLFTLRRRSRRGRA